MSANNSKKGDKRARDLTEENENCDNVPLCPDVKIAKLENNEKELNDNLTPIPEHNPQVTEIQSTTYQSQNSTMYFLNCIWKLEIPGDYMSSSFSKKEHIHENRTKCPINFMIDYDVKAGSSVAIIDYYIQIGQGEDIEKYCEAEKILKLKKEESIIKPFDEMKNEIEIEIQEDAKQNNNDDDNNNNGSIAFPLPQENQNQHNNSEAHSQVFDPNEDNTTSPPRSNEQKKEEVDIDQIKENLIYQHNPLMGVVDKDISDISPHHSNMTSQSLVNHCDDSQYSDQHPHLSKAHPQPKSVCSEDHNVFFTDDSFTISICYYFVKIQHENVGFNSCKYGDIQAHSIQIHQEAIRYHAKEEAVIVFEILVTKITRIQANYTGLVNEGMTCYMNSLLQALNMLGYFKQAIFQIESDTSHQHENAKNRKSIVHSFQKLFYDLLTEKKAVSTSDLISSFGWGKEQIFIQHDIQEFFLILSEVIKNEMKGTSVEGTFKYLFSGKILNYIQCLNVDYSSKKEESFSDLQLTVKGCSDIYQSFDKYTEEEVLEDKYHTENFGKQDAKKGLRFLSLPNVMVLQLKRFEYNSSKEIMEKINDYFVYYEQIDLHKYIEQGSDEVDTVFHLHAVILHSGSPNAGHYYAFLRPKVDSKWFKFNDEIVTYSDEYEVFHNNFGGTFKSYRHIANGKIIEFESQSYANAYILIYIKAKTRQEILSNFEVTDIPQEVLRMFQKEKEEEEWQKMILLRQSMNFNLNCFTREIMQTNTRIGMGPNMIMEGENGKMEWTNIKNKLMLNVPKNMTIRKFIEIMSIVSGIPCNRFKLFKFTMLSTNQLLKRFCFNMIYVDEQKYHNRLCEIADIPPKKMNYLYIHIDKSPWEDLALLEMNHDCNSPTDSPEVKYFSPNEDVDIHNTVYFDKTFNYWKIKANFNVSEINPYASLQRLDNNQNLILCVLKYAKITIINQLSYDVTLEIDHVVALPNNSNLKILESICDIRANYLKYLDPKFVENIKDYEKSEISYLVEHTCIDEILESNEYQNIGFKALLSCKAQYPIENMNNDGICVVLNLIWKEEFVFCNKKVSTLKEVISEKIDEIVTIFPVNFISEGVKADYFSPSAGVSASASASTSSKSLNKILGIPPRLIKLSSPEAEIKKIIIEYFQSNPPNVNSNLYPLIFDNPYRHNCFSFAGNFDYYLMDQYQEVKLVKDVMNTSHYQIIDLSTDNAVPKGRGLISSYKDYPMLKYINMMHQTIKFEINFLRLYQEERNHEYYVQEFMLTDHNNNVVNKQFAILPKKVETCEDIHQYIHKPILSKFYPSNLTFYFFIQHPQTLIGYELFLHRADKLKKFENGINVIEYRIQPYFNAEIPLISNQNKIFVCVYTKDSIPACFPLIVFFDRESTSVGDFKLCLIEKLKNIEEIKKLNIDQDSKIRFHTCSLKNWVPDKDKYMHPSMDDKMINYFFTERKSAFNILIELLSSGNSSMLTTTSSTHNNSLVINS